MNAIPFLLLILHFLICIIFSFDYLITIVHHCHIHPTSYLTILFNKSAMIRASDFDCPILSSNEKYGLVINIEVKKCFKYDLRLNRTIYYHFYCKYFPDHPYQFSSPISYLLLPTIVGIYYNRGPSSKK